MCASGGGLIGVKPILPNGFLRPFTVSPVSDPGMAGPLKVRVGLGAKSPGC
jgi:hypothetical protein